MAQEATLAVAENNSSEYSIIENASDFTLDADKLTASAIKGHIKLDSESNRLVNVIVNNAEGDIIIGSANGKDAYALTVSTGNDKVNGAITITNYADGSNNLNEIKVADKLHATGLVTIDNQETDIKVEAGKEITSEDAGVTLSSAKDIVVAGNVDAKTVATFTAGQDFVHHGGVINTAVAEVSAGRNVLLNIGSMVSGTSASLTAGTSEALVDGQGYIAEAADYLVDAPQLTASAAKTINLGSRANQ